MIDPIQALMVVVVTTLTIILSIIGFQVFLILREVQQSVKKVNKMLDDMGKISNSIATPIASISENLRSASGLAGVLGWLLKFRRKEKEEEKE